MKLKSFFLLILFLFLLIGASIYFYKLFWAPKFKTLKINGAEILVEIADTSEARAKGLANRESLPENQGMLFLFDELDYYSFWMKNTLIPLDFIWIRDNEIVEITQNIKPEDYQPPQVLTPKEKINAVLEVNSGVVQKFNIKLGDKISF